MVSIVKSAGIHIVVLSTMETTSGLFSVNIICLFNVKCHGQPVKKIKIKLEKTTPAVTVEDKYRT